MDFNLDRRRNLNRCKKLDFFQLLNTLASRLKNEFLRCLWKLARKPSFKLLLSEIGDRIGSILARTIQYVEIYLLLALCHCIKLLRMKIKTFLWEQMGPLGILTTFSAAVFFTPHANTREFGNAFALGYRDVNYCVLYAAFGFLTLVAFSYSCNVSYKIRIGISIMFYLIGVILFGISYWQKGNRRYFFAG